MSSGDEENDMCSAERQNCPPVALDFSLDDDTLSEYWLVPVPFRSWRQFQCKWPCCYWRSLIVLCQNSVQRRENWLYNHILLLCRFTAMNFLYNRDDDAWNGLIVSESEVKDPDAYLPNAELGLTEQKCVLSNNRIQALQKSCPQKMCQTNCRKEFWRRKKGKRLLQFWCLIQILDKKFCGRTLLGRMLGDEQKYSHSLAIVLHLLNLMKQYNMYNRCIGWRFCYGTVV